jgi:hypothetical protein
MKSEKTRESVTVRDFPLQFSLSGFCGLHFAFCSFHFALFGISFHPRAAACHNRATQRKSGYLVAAYSCPFLRFIESDAA